MQDGIVVEKVEAEKGKLYMGGMGDVIDSYMAQPGDEDYVPKEGEEGYVPPVELKFGDEGYVLKEGDEGYVVPEPEPIDYTTFEKDDLVVKVKEFETLVSKRDSSITQLQSDLDAKPSVGEDDALVKSLSEDFIGNYDKVKEKYNLPALSTIRDLVSEEVGIDDKVKLWQESELIKTIEQKHSLEEGEFEYDSNEASKAGTPSYDWDTQTSDKRGELVSVVKERQGAESSRLRAVETQQKKDLKWLADTYYESEDAVQVKLTDMNDEVTKISKGESSTEKHPFAIRNLMRGFYFDELVQSAVDKAVEDLTVQFAEHNMHLPSKELPTDVTKIKSPPPVKKNLDISERVREVSPMMASIFNSAKE